MSNNEKMKTLLEKVTLFFKFLKEILCTKEFIFFFPLAVFGTASFVLRSFVFVLCALIWIVPLVNEINKKEE